MKCDLTKAPPQHSNPNPQPTCVNPESKLKLKN